MDTLPLAFFTFLEWKPAPGRPWTYLQEMVGLSLAYIPERLMEKRCLPIRSTAQGSGERSSLCFLLNYAFWLSGWNSPKLTPLYAP